MKISYIPQTFQEDAAKAVVDVFVGQKNLPFSRQKMNVDPDKSGQQNLIREYDDMFMNAPIDKGLFTNDGDGVILDNLKQVQKRNGIPPSKKLDGLFNLSVEMETGVGKTYTYIKTMHELRKHYGWSKFIIVVPSVAIREGVYSSFKSTEQHFAEEYKGDKINYFKYNSTNLAEIERFATDSGIQAMIINSQAFNSNGKDAKRIYLEQDKFKSRSPIDVIAMTNPILIIDEPQSVEGPVTKQKLKDFNPLMTLRYSATYKEEYNMVYRLDAIDAYNKKLVKKIAVKSVTVEGTTGASGYIYLQNIIVAKDKKPEAKVQFDRKGKNGVERTSRILKANDNLYELSNELPEYKDRFSVMEINGRENFIEFANGIKVMQGTAVGDTNEDAIRRLQIRETIKSHIDKERMFYRRKEKIKVLSLFFIDEVAKYKVYDKENTLKNGKYADMFEEEYQRIVDEITDDDEYTKYIKNIKVADTHRGYFSIDKKSHKFIDSKGEKSEGGNSSDTEAYDLIMRNKERLLSMEEPVRFIFSHSALKEGWDNPNVFQICTLKTSDSSIRKRQEIGRGMRICVNENGVRMGIGNPEVGDAIHDINILTVIANESYENFTKELQDETAKVVEYRPRTVDASLFENKFIYNKEGEAIKVIDPTLAQKIYNYLIINKYVDLNDNTLTEVYEDAKEKGTLILPEEVKGYESEIIRILDTVYKPIDIIDEKDTVTIRLDEEKLRRKDFHELWKRINAKSAYIVEFDTDELLKKDKDNQKNKDNSAVIAINDKLHVDKLYSLVVDSEMNYVKSDNQLTQGTVFSVSNQQREIINENTKLKYDLVGRISEQTGLTRKTVVKILKSIDDEKFNMFKENPEDFIIKVSNLINEAKATVIVEHITYQKLDETFSTDIFTEPSLKKVPRKNTEESKKGLYNYLIYDSKGEKDFGYDLEKSEEVSVYVKLPRGFYINTPVGHYNPDWAIVFNEGSVKHIYFVAETKGSMSTMQLKKIENAKIECAKKHFNTICSDKVIYDVVKDYNDLWNIVTGEKT